MIPAILYVDCDKSNRLVFKHGLGHRFHIITTACCSDALRLLETESIGVVLTENRMPGMSGCELLAHVQTYFPGKTRLIVSAVQVPEAVSNGLAARCILKPWERKELSQTLEWAVQLQ